MCRHYQGSLDVIVTIVLLQASPDQTKKQQEDADRAMENEHEKDRQGEQEPKERDGSEAGRELPAPLERKSGSWKAMTVEQLCEAARDGDAAKVGTLLSTQGAQSVITYQDANGNTPLHFAALHGHEAVTKQLIAARCIVDLEAEDGFTPLHIAAASGHAAVAKQLIAARCNVDLQDKRGYTPLSQKGMPPSQKCMHPSRSCSSLDDVTSNPRCCLVSFATTASSRPMDMVSSSPTQVMTCVWQGSSSLPIHAYLNMHACMKWLHRCRHTRISHMHLHLHMHTFSRTLRTACGDAGGVNVYFHTHGKGNENAKGLSYGQAVK